MKIANLVNNFTEHSSFITHHFTIMAYSQDYLDFILEQLTDFGVITPKKMFGGVGFYKEGVMFGGIMGGAFHLKVDDTTRPKYEAEGMTSFFDNGKNKTKPKYYEVPVDIIEDRTEIAGWAAEAFEVAKSTKKVKKKKEK